MTITEEVAAMNKNWSTKHMPRLDGKLAIVTGANRGLGYHTALELARAGAEVIMAGRDAARTNEARSQIIAHVPAAKLQVENLDLSSLASIRAFTTQFLESGRALDILINNAGVMSIATRETTVDGFERQFGINHLGPFALTGALLPALRRSPGARVVALSSNLAKLAKIDFDNLQSEKSYSPQGAYCVSKLANQLFMLELHRRAPAGLLSVGAHPGVASTDLAQTGPGLWFIKKIAQPPSIGALSQLYAAVGEDVTGGEYFGPSRWMEMAGPPMRAKPAKRAFDAAAAQELWAKSETLTGVQYAF
jgi:NAD(P)-dependent dehydrogenase (short-subunit alcohol dehydrogenase family)